MNKGPKGIGGKGGQRGFTLIEAAIVMAVGAVLLGAGVPSFKETFGRRALEGRAAELATDVQYLRSEAVARNESMRISFGGDAGGSCYVIHSAAGVCGCDSTGTAQCSTTAVALKTVAIPAHSGVRLQANVESTLFDGVRGTATPSATLRLIDADGRAVHHVVNVTGRVRSCSPKRAIPGYRAC